MNDLIFEVIYNLLQIKLNRYNENEILLNSSYKYKREDLTTELRKMRLADDKEPRKDNLRI